ncbi:uncharacterized protein KZ484_023852 [Pholidichthys leucotaenia]
METGAGSGPLGDNYVNHRRLCFHTDGAHLPRYEHPASPATDQDHSAPEPSPARSQFGTSPSTLSRTGKRKRSNTKQDLSTIFASMQEAEREQHREQMELQREHQREQRELQQQQLELNSLLVDEVRQSREAEVAVRREEIAQNAALNNTLMAVFETLARRV